MKNSLKYIPVAVALLLTLFSCDENDHRTVAANGPEPGTDTPVINNNTMKITIGTETFTATLLDNATANAFKATLPLSVTMTELNGNEKYVNLPNGLPTNASNPGTIQAGDLMMYGATTFVLFYETFSTSYSYTKIGQVDNTDGLSAALGNGNVTVTFELQ